MVLRKICNTTRRLCTMMSRNKLVLYGDDASPPVRFVRMTACMLDIPLEYRLVDLFKGEHRTEEYKKINPLQKVPALVTGTQVIADSHAIALHLCALAGARGRRLLPAEPHRAAVHEMMFYNASTLFPIDSYVLSSFFAGRRPAEEKIEEWQRGLDHLEHKLKDRTWLTGDEMTICDLCIIATTTSMETLMPVTRRHDRVMQWMRRFEDLPCYDINKLGVERLRSFVESKKNNLYEVFFTIPVFKV
ncbi:glutathione S-transferase E14-like [Aricia agestis]|uniref:glutathione S-transferase E14-like n=1 Tax=Aricia agestis TaxID=91739 RepID=UPI001C206439|nr:glutathione S-transferase E14-like [Aricia agestis]